MSVFNWLLLLFFSIILCLKLVNALVSLYPQYVIINRTSYYVFAPHKWLVGICIAHIRNACHGASLNFKSFMTMLLEFKSTGGRNQMYMYMHQNVDSKCMNESNLLSSLALFSNPVFSPVDCGKACE